MKESSKHKPNVPNLRFPGFEEHWITNKLGELLDFKVTNSFSRDKLNYDNGRVKNIHYGDIHKKFQTLLDINFEEIPFINDDITLHKISNESYCKEGDIIFADASEDLNDVGKSIEIFNLNNEKLLAGLHTLQGRPKPNNFHNGFLGHLLKSRSVRLQIKREAQGTKVLSINVGRVSKINLFYPVVEEQKKITQLLFQIDQRILTQNKIIDRLESLMLGFRQKIFSQELCFLDENGNEFINWEKFKIGNIGKTFNGLTGKTKEDFGKGKLFIQYKQIFDDSEIDILKCGLVEVSKGENQNELKFGDVCFTTSSETADEIATSSVFLNKMKNVFLNSFCFGYRYNHEILNPFFARYLFREITFRKKVIPLAQGSTRYNISKHSFIKLDVDLPCLKEQKKIANFLSSLDNKLEKEKLILKQYQEQKKYLLQNLFI